MRKPQAKPKKFDAAQLTIVELETLIESGDVHGIEVATSAIRNLFDRIRPKIRQHPEAGFFVYKTAQCLTRDVSEMAQDNPPAWLTCIAKTEYEVPWLMTNGKPVGFEASDSALSWGSDIIRRGKNQFVAPQTRDVANILQYIYLERLMFRTRPERITKRSEHYSEASEIIKRNQSIATLPDLSRKTKDQWWPHVKGFIRNTNSLTTNKKRDIREGLKLNSYRHTDAAVEKEYLKRCKGAFNSLCPAD